MGYSKALRHVFGPTKQHVELSASNTADMVIIPDGVVGFRVVGGFDINLNDMSISKEYSFRFKDSGIFHLEEHR